MLNASLELKIANRFKMSVSVGFEILQNSDLYYIFISITVYTFYPEVLYTFFILSYLFDAKVHMQLHAI